MRSEEVIERAGAHLASCRELQTQLDESSFLVRHTKAVSAARAAIQESIALTRALVERVRIEIQSEGTADGDHQQ